MKYRIRKYISRTPNSTPLYCPQYRKHWYSEWVDGKYYEWCSEAKTVIKSWILDGIPEESSYIKYP